MREIPPDTRLFRILYTFSILLIISVLIFIFAKVYHNNAFIDAIIIFYIFVAIIMQILLWAISDKWLLILLNFLIHYKLLDRDMIYRKRKKVTVDIEGVSTSIDNLTQEEADDLAERFKNLHPTISSKEQQHESS